MTAGVERRRCRRCGAGPAAGRFCVRCGEPLAGAAGSPPEGSPPGTLDAPELFEPAGQARLVHCPACDGANAASRLRCGRCGAALRPGVDGVEQVAAPAVPSIAHGGFRMGAPDTAATPAGREGLPATLLVVTVLAGLAIVGVLFTILSARGAGLFAGPATETPGEPVAVEAVEARASSEVPPSGDVTYGPDNVIDGDETTAWKEGVAGDGAGEWVEVRFSREVPVVRLLVWNGYQRPGRFAEHNRVAAARLEVGDRGFTADLLDVEGPQAIDLPEPVLADRLRLVIIDVHSGERYEDTAVSRLEVLADAERG